MTSKPEDERVPIARVLGGMAIHPLLPGENPLEAFVLIKTLDADGNPAWSFRTTNPLNNHELLGAMTVQIELLKRRLTRMWEDDEEEEDSAS